MERISLDDSLCRGWATPTPLTSTTPAALPRPSITLPKGNSSGGDVTLDVQYGGRSPLTRSLHPHGCPRRTSAPRNDWDEITEDFTAVRGLGYVTWYPVAIEAASLSEGNAVFDAVARWKDRHARTDFDVTLPSMTETANSPCKWRSASQIRVGAKLRRANDSAERYNTSADGSSASWLGERPFRLSLQRIILSCHGQRLLCCTPHNTPQKLETTPSRQKPTIRCCTNGSANSAKPAPWWN